MVNTRSLPTGAPEGTGTSKPNTADKSTGAPEGTGTSESNMADKPTETPEETASGENGSDDGINNSTGNDTEKPTSPDKGKETVAKKGGIVKWILLAALVILSGSAAIVLYIKIVKRKKR